MFGIRNRKNSYQRNDRGAALMVTVIIIGILLVFTLSLLLVSYTLYASQSKNTASLKCSEAANTLSGALVKELEGDSPVDKSSLWKYIRYNLIQSDQVWPYYDPSDPDHTKEKAFRYFDLEYNTNYFGTSMPDGYPGLIRLCMYWTLPKGRTIPSGKDPWQMTSVQKTGIRLCIEITCSSGSQSFTVCNNYELRVLSFDPDETIEPAQLQNGISNPDYNPKGVSEDKINLSEKWRWDYKVGVQTDEDI